MQKEGHTGEVDIHQELLNDYEKKTAVSKYLSLERFCWQSLIYNVKIFDLLTNSQIYNYQYQYHI